MQELMIHVERIVRPVRASNSRKLRMRQELLAHLRAALEEERGRCSGDEAAAIAQAKLRLGKPAELTDKLQKSVPLLERLLLAKLPTSRGFDDWERRAGRRIYGERGPMTMTHITILAAMAILCVVPLFVMMSAALKSNGMQTAHKAFLFAGAVGGYWALFGLSARFVDACAKADDSFRWGNALLRGLAIFVLQIGLAFFVVASVASRIASGREIALCAGMVLPILAASMVVGRVVSVLRRPYDRWLTLDIAE